MNIQEIQELAELSNSLKEIKSINDKNIDEFFNNLEYFLRDSLNLKNDIWVDFEISDEYPNIFGWCKINAEWHIVIAQREKHNIPDSDEIHICGSVPMRNIFDYSLEEKMNVFFNIDLLIQEIRCHFDQEISRSKELNEKFRLKTKLLENLLD